MHSNPTEMNEPDAARTELLEELFQKCAACTPYQLYRLRSTINHLLDEPTRIREVKSQLRVGDEIEYYDDLKNRLVRAVITALNRTRASIENLDDGELWFIEYASIELGPNLFPQVSQAGSKLGRSSFSIGDAVVFSDRNTNEHIGTIIRLNQKSATVETDAGIKWRVGYSLLFPVLDGKSSTSNRPTQQLLLRDDRDQQ